MTEMTSRTTSCRARRLLPWQGMLRTSATFPRHGTYPAETLVAVTGEITVVTATEEADGGLQVQVGRVQGTWSESDASGSVARDQVDEVLGAVIEGRLLGKPNICWSSRGSWKNRRYVATQDFVLTEETGEPPEQVAVSRGERFDPEPSGGGYLIEKNGVVGPVARGMLSFDASLPPPASDVGLLCYELGMYAAALAGLCPDFVRLATTRHEASDSSVYWIQASGGIVYPKTYGRDALGSARPQRGDFVLFYPDHDADQSIHTAVATGDAQGLYSLWDAQARSPVVTTIQELFDLPGLPTPPVCVKIAIPGWHLRRA